MVTIKGKLMTVPSGWQGVYRQLCDFIAAVSSIEIGMNVVRIPEDVRTEFYRLFDTVRSVFVEEKFPRLLNEAGAVSENYTKAEQEVTELLGLDDVSMVAGLHRFLRNPRDGLIRELFNPLFDLLKGKVDIETFEEGASRNIKASFGSLYRLGYEKWVALSLAKLLEADKSFQVIPRQFIFAKEEVIMETPSFEEEIPPPKESKHLSFQYEPTATLTVPDFIVHSVKINRYVALRSEIGKAFGIAANASDKREWYPLVAHLEPGLTLVYVADKPEELSLVADREKICRPDLIIECREQKDWYEKEGLEKVKLNHDALKPTLGTYIVSREPVPEQAYKELMPEQIDEPAPEQVSKEPALEQEQKSVPGQEPEKQGVDIHVLTVGFERSKLEPIIDALISIGSISSSNVASH